MLPLATVVIHCSDAGPRFPDESLVQGDVAFVWSVWTPAASQDSPRIEERSLQPNTLHKVKWFWIHGA